MGLIVIDAYQIFGARTKVFIEVAQWSASRTDGVGKHITSSLKVTGKKADPKTLK